MKRVREVDEIESEMKEAWAHYQVLRDELWAHPVKQRARRAEQRQELMGHLPQALHAVVLNVPFEEYGVLEKLEVESHLDENDQGRFCRMWLMTAWFSNRGFYSCEVDVSSNYSPNDDRIRGQFEPIDFDARAGPVAVWEEALAVNNDEFGPALAALCYCCCERLNDYNAYPVEAFQKIRGKNEVVSDD